MTSKLMVPATVGALFLASGLSAQATAIFSNTPGAPTNSAPTLALPFDAGGGVNAAFFRLAASATGTQWTIMAELDQTGTVTTTNDAILIKNGTTILAREADPAPALPAETVGTLTTNAIYPINDLGEVLAAIDLINAPDETIVYFDAAGTPTLIGREGDPIPTAPAGYTLADPMSSLSLSDSGAFSFESSGGTPGEVIVIGTVAGGISGISLDDGVDSPGIAGRTWENFDLNDVITSPDGTTQIIDGDLDGSTTDDDVVAVNNVAVLQAGQIVAPLVDPIGFPWFVNVDPLNNWYASFELTTDVDILVRNGVIVAEDNGPIMAGSTELFDEIFDDETFQFFCGNLAGQFAFSGVTNNPDGNINTVFLVDDGTGNRRLIAREGDPVDVDGNGIFDDDRFIAVPQNESAVLTLDSLIFVASLRNGAGATVDNAIVSIPTVGPVARFTVDRTLVPGAPGPVVFTSESSSSAGPVTHEWDFDNDGTVDSTLANPTFNYPMPGTFTVSLTVSDGTQTSTTTVADLITVNAVSAGIGAAPSAGAVPLIVQFTYTGDGASTWAWDFEDDGVVDSTLENPTHVYASAGNFSVRLDVTNAFGTDTLTIPNLIQALGATENTLSADILHFDFNEVRGSQVANTASTTAAPATAPVINDPVGGWQIGAGAIPFGPLFEPNAGAMRSEAAAEHYVATNWNAVVNGSFTITWRQRLVNNAGSTTLAYQFGGDGDSFRGFTGGVAGNGFWMRNLFTGAPDHQFGFQMRDAAEIGMWRNIAIVVDNVAGTMTSYVDGALDTTTNFPAGSVNWSKPNPEGFRVGRHQTTNDYCESFDIDDFRYYAQALAAADLPVAADGEVARSGVYGSGCGAAGIPTIRGDSAPQTGNLAFNVVVDNFQANALVTLQIGITTSSDILDPVQPSPLPIDIGSLLPAVFPGCQLEVGLSAGESLGVLPTGTGALNVPIPAVPALAGVHFYFQGIGLGTGGGQLTPALDVNVQN